MRGKSVFSVRSYECGADARATLPTICNYLQEAASVNAEHLGFSKSDFDSAGENISWVLTRLVVEMSRYPMWKDVVTVETFPRGGRRIVAWRDFEIKDSDGARLGVASSEWMLINLATRKAVPIPEAVFAAADAGEVPILGEMPFTKIKFPEVAEAMTPSRYLAQKSHIDLNGHVNNVHYIEWMLEPCASASPAHAEVVFRSEARAGDEVRVEIASTGGNTYHRVFAADGHDHIVAITSP